jgi:DNA-binding MarR family transcriptional regulator
MTASDRLVCSYISSADSPRTLVEIAADTKVSVHTLVKVMRRLVIAGHISQRKCDGTTQYFIPSEPSAAVEVL